MELTADLVAIQGILSSLVKNIGEFTRINYRGGNEDKIIQVMNEIQKYLTSKNYIKAKKINEVFDKQLEEIVLFLAINTTYKHKFELEEYTHLVDIIPPLSKCLFANIAYGLDLCKYYCTAIDKLPLEASYELLDEMQLCLNKCAPKIQLEYTSMFLTTAAKKLESVDYSSKTEDDIDNITEVTNTMLRNLTGIYFDKSKNMNSEQIYRHMGHCLLCLFNLLLYSNKKSPALKKFIANVIRTCCCVLENVTINVFCAWAEFETEDEVFQTVISEKAYMIIEAYEKIPEASMLISMLGTIARKPLTISEMIRKSDMDTIIKKINKCDANQTTWFRALLTTQIFKNKEAMKCLHKWSHLCNDEDVTLMLNLCIQNNDVEAKQLVLRCASSLNLEQLRLVLTRHFYRNKFSHVLDDNIYPNLMLMLNKLNENTHSKQNLELEFSLLLLSNPAMFYRLIYIECLHNTYYADGLKDFFDNIKEISQIDSIGVSSLYEVLDGYDMTQQTASNVAHLLKTLIEIGYFKKDVVFSKILFPLVKKYYSDENLECFNIGLQIILEIRVPIPVKSNNRNFLEMCLTVMNDKRCKFLNFDSLKQDIVKSVVELFIDLCEINNSIPIAAFEEMEDEDLFTDYYRKYLTGNTIVPFFKVVCPGFDIHSDADCVSQLLQVLPSAVLLEWLIICDEMTQRCGARKTMELITDVMILLSQLVETQDVDNNKSVYVALEYCIYNFGRIIQNIQQHSDLNTEIVVTKQVCRLIAKLPASIKDPKGLYLANTLTERSLKTLGKDKEFLCHLILIKNSNICKTLAEKIKG